jgi:hypothetical protein
MRQLNAVTRNVLLQFCRNERLLIKRVSILIRPCR